MARKGSHIENRGGDLRREMTVNLYKIINTTAHGRVCLINEEHADGAVTMYTIRDDGSSYAQEWQDGKQEEPYPLSEEEAAQVLAAAGM